MTGCMQHSLNVCLASIAVDLGSGSFYKYMQAFGIGRMTGVDLADEVAGRLKLPGDGDWSEFELGANAFGQGVSVTPLQMVMGASAIANEGKMMAPMLVRSVIRDGKQTDLDHRLVGTPIKPETARTLSEMLANSLEIESSTALVEGYRVAGKTGTAQIPNEFGYSETDTNASFVGWGPVDDPRFLIYIWLEKPRSDSWSSIVAAPVFSEAVKRLVVIMDIPPDQIRRQLTNR
jgi:cell division protein FtsI/penicillin-binding protein 2